MSIHPLHLVAIFLICLLSHNLIADTADPSDYSGALILEGNGDYENAIKSYKQAIENIEGNSGPFSERLIEPLMGVARSEFSLAEYENSISFLVRAQHLVHRSQGVYATRQQEGVDLLIKTHLAMDEVKLADKQHKFKLFLAEHNVGAGGIRLLPALDIINNWYIQTGQLNRARKSLQRSREIIKSEGGDFDPLQTETLVKLAKVRRLGRFCCSHRLLEEGLEIIDANPNLGSQKKGLYYLELADAYTAGGKPLEAKVFYAKAWTLLNEANHQVSFDKPRGIEVAREISDGRSVNSKIFIVERERFGSRQYKEATREEKRTLDSLTPQEFRFAIDENAPKRRIRDLNTGSSIMGDNELRVIGHPYEFNRQQLRQVLPIRMLNNDALAKLNIELVLTVDAEGRTSQVRVITPNVPTKLSRLMREVVNRSYFRPRLEDGIPVVTTDFSISQRFKP
ncbi:MAG: tetratricopeptide (TPR) repeat protein [Candidatus Azotimanducaceae bacterium]|jgi:tetratricopeptide (TPR) repeat protein